MQSVATIEPVATPIERSNALVFFATLAVVTIAPLILLPILQIGKSTAQNELVWGIWIIAGYGHVLSTIWFGSDPDYRPVIQENRTRMIASLAVIPMVMAIIALSSQIAWSWVFAAYLVWQAQHYNRQNYGILAFASSHDGLGPLPREVGWIIHLTTCAGAVSMVTMPSIYPQGVAPLPFLTPPAALAARLVAIASFATSIGVAAWLVLKDDRLRRSPTTLLFLCLTVVFFLPALLPGRSTATFWPYAMAHGLQYLVITGITALRSRLALSGLLVFLVLATVLGVLASRMTNAPWAQIYTGIIMWHFLADARLWRLRDPTVRAIVRKRFDFVFTPAQA